VGGNECRLLGFWRFRQRTAAIAAENCNGVAEGGGWDCRCQFCLSAKPGIHLPEAEACSAAAEGGREGTG